LQGNSQRNCSRIAGELQRNPLSLLPQGSPGKIERFDLPRVYLQSGFAEVHRREGDRRITGMMRGLGATLGLNSVRSPGAAAVARRIP
jgi:hypothetical protein